MASLKGGSSGLLVIGRAAMLGGDIVAARLILLQFFAVPEIPADENDHEHRQYDAGDHHTGASEATGGGFWRTFHCEAGQFSRSRKFATALT